MKRKTQFPAAMDFPTLLASLLILFGTLAVASSGAAEEPSREQIHFFEKEVRPLLAAKCFECHSEKKQSGSLRLDRLGNILEGGDSGPAIVPGKPEESLLVEAINYESFEMPPSGKLSSKEIDVLTRWVQIGAPWPAAGRQAAATKVEGDQFTAEDRAWWAFQPLAKPQVPEVDDERWSRNPIDRFIYQKLREANLTPAPPADRVTLLRRAYFDLIGLPPTLEQIDAFLADGSPNAFEKVVDQLLDSPHYGEMWARHWLDLVRYAESDGFNQDAYRPEIWRYRDYVVQSFNEDKPYPQFVLEQLAGDEVAPDDPQALAATGYLRHYLYEYNQRDARTHWSDILNDLTDATGDVFLGMGMGCARCHDHKFDPILQKDYYRLQAFFTPILPRDDIPFATPQQRQEYAAKLAVWEEKTAEIRKRIDEILAPGLADAAESQTNMFPPDVQEMMRKAPHERAPYEHQVAELANRQVRERQEAYVNTAKTSKDKKWQELQDLYKQLEAFDDIKPAPLPMGMTVTDVSRVAPPTYIPDRKKQDEILPGFLTLMDPEPAECVSLENSTGRRTALAKWIASPDNPLTTRVVANRIWQYHFGTGLVATSSDFGTLGEPPSHPELLDWLTREFIEGGWSFKRLHRMIMNSETYKISADHPDPSIGERVDPTNRLHWRGRVRRLQAEQIRDAALALSGELQLDVGGPSVPASTPRRSIYVIFKRNTQDPVLGAFDLPGGINSTASRNVTTTPTQALLMINGQWMLDRAAAMARRLSQSQSADLSNLASTAYRMVHGSAASPDQLAMLVEFLTTQRQRIVEDRPPVKPVTQPRPDGSLAAAIKPGSHQEYLRVERKGAFPEAAFTVEAVVRLDSMFEDAAVRTIASQWNSNNRHRGWSLGVTSAKSAYKPRNLILQFVGDNAKGELGYEVVASNLHLELKQTYYVAASVNIADPTEAGITFYVRNLDQPESEMQIARVKHEIVANIQSNSDLVLGGRDAITAHRWDGLIDDVRLSNVALKQEDLALNRAEPLPSTVGFWRFEAKPGFFANEASGGPSIVEIADTRKPAVDDSMPALTDLCHVLLNSSGFLYTD